jgi:hypothetical protein
MAWRASRRFLLWGLGGNAPEFEARRFSKVVPKHEAGGGRGGSPRWSFERLKRCSQRDVKAYSVTRELRMAEVHRQLGACRWGVGLTMQAKTMKKSATTEGESPSRLIDARIKELDDWRGKTLSHVRALIKQADPEVVEEWKWRGVPVWSHDGLICTGETYKSVVKVTFSKGASLKDPSGLFNSSLEGNARRAIDFHEGDEIDEDAFKTLIRAAAALNRSSAR